MLAIDIGNTPITKIQLASERCEKSADLPASRTSRSAGGRSSSPVEVSRWRLCKRQFSLLTQIRARGPGILGAFHLLNVAF